MNNLHTQQAVTEKEDIFFVMKVMMAGEKAPRKKRSLKELISEEEEYVVEDKRHFELDRESEFPPTTSFVLNPLADWRLNWDIFMMLLIAYVMIVTPFELAFVVSRPLRKQFERWSTLSPNKRSGLWMSNVLVNLGFLADMFLNFITGFFDKKVWRTDHASIAKKYLESWFFLDLLTVLPIEYVAGEEATLVRLLRLFRLAKLLRVLKSPRLIARMTKHVDLSTKIQTVIKYCAILLVLVHWSACALRLVTDFNLGQCQVASDNSSCPQTYLTQQHNWGDGIWAVYLEASNWALVALNGEASGYTHAELTLGLVVMLTGIVILAFLIGDLSNIMSNLDPVKNEFVKTIDSLNDYMHRSGFPKGLRLKLREYILMSEPVYRDAYNKEMLTKLSPTLVAIVARQNLGKVVNRIPFYTYTIQSVLGHKVGARMIYRGDDVKILKLSGFLRYDVARADREIVYDVPHSQLHFKEHSLNLIERSLRLNYQRDTFVSCVARIFEMQLFMAWDQVVHRNLSLNDTLYVVHTGKILLLNYELRKPFGICIKQHDDFFGGDVALLAVRNNQLTTRPYSAHATQTTQTYALDARKLHDLLNSTPSLTFFKAHFRMWGCWLLLQRKIIKTLAKYGSLVAHHEQSNRMLLLRRSSTFQSYTGVERDSEENTEEEEPESWRQSALPSSSSAEEDFSSAKMKLVELSADILKHGLSSSECRSKLATPRVLDLTSKLLEELSGL